MEPEPRVKLTLRASISPSEDPAKVAKALESIAGEGLYEVRLGQEAKLITEDPKVLGRLRDQFRDRHVRSAARRQMLLNLEGDSTSIMLNRQAAAAGAIALCGTPEESPLGPVYLRIQADKIGAAIDRLTSYEG